MPFVLAFLGFIVQRRLSGEGLRKDYVQMAIGILRESKDEELRKWAVSVVDANAPVPLSKGAKTSLESNTVYVPVQAVVRWHARMNCPTARNRDRREAVIRSLGPRATGAREAI